MTEPTPATPVAPVAPVAATPPVPAQNVQPTPVAKPGVPPVEGEKPPVTQVPLPALQEERVKRQEEHTRAEALELQVAELQRTVQQSQYNQQVQPQQQQSQVDPKAELEALWEEDPKKAVRVEIMYAMDWRDRIDSGLEVQADELQRRYPDFNAYRSTALGQVRSLPLNQRGGAGILEAAYFMVRGQNADTMIQQRETELLEKYRRGEISAQGLATPPGSFSTPAPVQGTAATDEQQRVAAVMGMTVEDYMSNVQVPK
jgi:hypothetical protein